VGRTGRAERTGEAFTFVSPDEEGELRQIERAIGRRLPRVTVPDFNYTAKPEQRLEVPLAERIAEIRARKAQERQRAKEKAERRAQHEASEKSRLSDKARRDAERRARPAAGGSPGGPSRGPRSAGSGSGGAGGGRRRGGRGRGPGGGGRPASS
jgi:ATP-dependent RNA helicase RhlE